MPLGDDSERRKRRKRPQVLRDKRHRERARQLLTDAAHEAFTDTPRRHRVKQSFKTFRNTKLHQTDRHSFMEFGFNAGAGMVIALATLPLAALPLLAFAVTSLITGGAGAGIGFGIERRRNAKARKRLRTNLTGGAHDTDQAEAFAALEATRRHYRTLMVTKSYFENHHEIYCRQLYKAAITWHEKLDAETGEPMTQSARDLYAAALKSAKKHYGSQRGLNRQAEFLMQRGERLSLRKVTFFSAQLNSLVDAHRRYIETATGLLLENIENLLPLVEPQAHLAGNHNCKTHCCITDEDQLEIRDFHREHRYDSDAELSEIPTMANDLIDAALTDVKRMLSKSKDEQDEVQSRRNQKKFKSHEKRWAASDAITETGVGTGISSMFGESAAAVIGSASSGGVAGAFIGKLFSMVGTHFTVNIPALKEIADVAQAPMDDKRQRMDFAKRVEEERLHYALGKLYHYQKKFDGYLATMQAKHDEVSRRPARGSKWNDCAETYRFTTMFFYCAKTLMKYDAHCHFVECFIDGHAELIAERSLLRKLEKTAISMDDWHAYWGQK